MDGTGQYSSMKTTTSSSTSAADVNGSSNTSHTSSFKTRDQRRETMPHKNPEDNRKYMKKYMREYRSKKIDQEISENEIVTTDERIAEIVTSQLLPLKKLIVQSVHDEIASQSDLDKLQLMIKEHVEKRVKSIIKNDLQGFLKDLVEHTVKHMNKKLKQEHEVTKQLAYSIDAEIRHLSMRSGISDEMEAKIERRIQETAEKILNQKELEGKNVKQITSRKS